MVIEVATLITNDFGNREPTRDIVVNKKDSRPKRISELHPSYMALQYPLLFLYGEDGYHDNIPYHTNTGKRKTTRDNVIMKEYYAYVIQYRKDQGTTLLRGGRLFQQYLIDAYTTIKEQRLIVYVIKFQKQGQLHEHILLWLEEYYKCKIVADIDDMISTELPSPTDDPVGYKAVTDYMLHEPCGKDVKSAACNARIDQDGNLKSSKECFTYGLLNEACFTYGLLNDNKEWIQAIQEASLWALGPQICDIFVTILLFYDLMTEQIQNYFLLKIEDLLNTNGRTLIEFQKLPQPNPVLRTNMDDRLIKEALAFDMNKSRILHHQLYPQLNPEQRLIYEEVVDSVHNKKGQFHFVYGPGGTKKTFLYKTIISRLRSKLKIVLAVASSGDALKINLVTNYATFQI
ncbi:ATP-dependent DNA helicase PIF1-like protein [Tanacetum coccineum]